MNYDIKKDFFELCYECLYYGYTWAFIKENYKEFISDLGLEKAKNIYDDAFNKICEE